MPDDDTSVGSSVVGIELAERIQLCWSPTQLPREYGWEVRQDLFEQLLTEQLHQASERGLQFPPGQHFAEVFDDEPAAGSGGIHRFLIDVADGRCRVLPSVSSGATTEWPGCLLTAFNTLR